MQCIYNYNIVCVLQDLEWLVALFFQLSVPARSMGPDRIGRHSSITLWELRGRTSPCSSATKLQQPSWTETHKAPKFKTLKTKATLCEQ